MSDKPKMSDKSFAMAFETRKDKGYIRYVKVTIEYDILMGDEEVRVDLADHPLYDKLQSYVLANKR